ATTTANCKSGSPTPIRASWSPSATASPAGPADSGGRYAWASSPPPTGRPRGAPMRGILGAYEWVATQTDADFVVKFDSDALVIAPFARQIDSAMLAQPNAAIFGAYKIDCNGNPRGFNGWGGFTNRLQKLALFQYEPKRF